MQGICAYDEQRELGMRSISRLLIRISRVRSTDASCTCLHEMQGICAYDEQRELGMRSISRLLIRISRVRSTDAQFEFYFTGDAHIYEVKNYKFATCVL